jgi:small-conductance mechanosensitive channel
MNRRLDVNVGVAYGTDPRRVIDLLLDVARSTEGVAQQPEPLAVFVGFGASSLDFTLRAWTNNFAEWVRIRSELTLRVNAAIVAAGIEIPFPQQDLHLRSISAEAGARLRQGDATAAGRESAGPREEC